ncbi:Peptidyl-prolyl cis-trans isomerase CWC27 like protein [Eufriesea mexicana]|uniref:Peptidyl-prolyl cis-trans isomerase n=1 Tax=Eufriesea mexicana TaxID=516756 RepID=A0A310SUY6_9HYME|nr:Peptidyl-prolyl cis-trans isomerase CWC27 like protein [Eufriesea mexicana]
MCKVRIKGVRRGNAYYAESRSRKEVAYVSTEKNVWHRHGNMRMIEKMENEQVVIVMKGKVKLNIECKCRFKAKMCRNIYRNLETIQAASIMVLWHIMDMIGPLKLMLKGGKRIIKGFITQGGDPTSTGEGGKIYGEPFKNEFHTGLRFCQRDLIVMSNAAKDGNTSQFLFTLGSTSELQSKHAIFGKVTEETIYNMLKLKKARVDEESEEVKDSSKAKTAAVSFFAMKDFVTEISIFYHLVKKQRKVKKICDIK